MGFPDRRPVIMLRTWNGSWSEANPLGLSPPYRGDDAGEVIARDLDRLYAQGWRRIMMLAPAGGPQGVMIGKGFTEFWRRSPVWRRVMRDALGEWTSKRRDATLGLYTGHLTREGKDPTDQQIATHLSPWLEMGVREFGLDATSPPQYRDAFVRAARWLKRRGARAVMEAFPVENGQIVQEFLHTSPMLALRKYAKVHDPKDQWRFDPANSEVWIGVGVDRQVQPSEAALRRLHERGYVLLVYSLEPRVREAALRIGSGG